MIEYIVKAYEDRTEWYLNGLLHREDGPAWECVNGDKAWHRNGKCHRENGPAVEYANGDKYWYLNNRHHREDGPAVELISGYKSWYLNGKEYTESNYLEEMAKRKNPCNGKVVEIDGKKYQLIAI